VHVALFHSIPSNTWRAQEQRKLLWCSYLWTTLTKVGVLVLHIAQPHIALGQLRAAEACTHVPVREAASACHTWLARSSPHTAGAGCVVSWSRSDDAACRVAASAAK
jgi:hypothetical protein